MTLKGRIALVTGGAGQLGRVIVRKLAREGALVFVATRGPVPEGVLGGENGSRIRVLEADVTSEESVANLFTAVIKNGGRADILVNCAGGFAFTGPLAGTEARDWDTMMAVNLRSVFLCCRGFLRQNGLEEYGRIINFTAQTVFRPSRGRAPYAVAKGGVAILTELLGEELRGRGVTANAIAPSIIRTPENLKGMPGADASAWVDPEEIAAEVVHLCEPSAAAINGAIIPMFGGVQA